MPSRPLRLAFAGTPEFAAVALLALRQAGHELALVLTQPDRPAGRGLKLQASAVKRVALESNLPLIQPRSLRLDGRYPEDAAQARQAISDAQVELIVVAAYGLILPAWVLTLPARGCLNIHGSLLPRWRGAAPIQRAIEAGDRETGITIMQMDEGLDTGAMLLSEAQPIHPDDTAATLQARLAVQGGRLIVRALSELTEGRPHAQPQPAEGVSYAHKIAKDEAWLDWTQDSLLLERRVRAFDPFPGAALCLEGSAVKVWLAASEPASPGRSAQPGEVLSCSADGIAVACGEGQLRLTQVQVPGGRRIDAVQFLQQPLGRQLRPGTRLPSGAPTG